MRRCVQDVIGPIQQPNHHVATHELRRMDIVWSEEEITLFDNLKSSAEVSGESTSDYVKMLLKYILDNAT